MCPGKLCNNFPLLSVTVVRCEARHDHDLCYLELEVHSHGLSFFPRTLELSQLGYLTSQDVDSTFMPAETTVATHILFKPDTLPPLITCSETPAASSSFVQWGGFGISHFFLFITSKVLREATLSQAILNHQHCPTHQHRQISELSSRGDEMSMFIEGYVHHTSVSTRLSG